MISQTLEVIKAGYETRPPSPQTIADIFTGIWKSTLPSLSSGKIDMFADSRPQWFASFFQNGLFFKTILELGPFEAYQTYQLERLGAQSIHAVEGNKINFLKCLCVKEIYGLKARFSHGDILLALKCAERYDVVWASGVLYHMQKPVEFLEELCRVAEYSFIWTHFFDESKISAQQLLNFLPEFNQRKSYSDRQMTLHARSYLLQDYDNNIPGHWEGAPEDRTYWMEYDDIYHVIRANNFDVLGESVSQMEPQGLPCLQLAIKKRHRT